MTDKDLSNIRHDLRTPINHILGYSEMLQEDAEDMGQADFIPDLQNIHSSGKHLLLLINDMLDTSNIDAGKMNMEQVRHGLDAPLNQLIGCIEILLKKAKDKGQADFIPDLEKIQAATNHFITLADSYLLKAETDKIDRAADTSRTPVQSTVPTALPSVEEKVPSSQHASLLVVDDNEANRDMLSRRLVKVGYAAMVADDGKQAIELIKKNAFDVVLLDIMMPGIDGIQVLKILRETYSMTELPIIMVTAKDQSEGIVDALNLGANDYVTKPIDLPVTLARIRTQLSLKRAEEKIKKYAKELEEKLKLLEDKGISRYDSLIKRKNSYIIKEKRYEKSLAIYSNLTKFGIAGLCITISHPDVLRATYDLSECKGRFLWLSTSAGEGDAVSPTNLVGIHGKVIELIKNNKNSVVLFFGLENIITLNGFERSLGFLSSFIDSIIINDSRLIISIDPAALNPRELSLIEKSMIEIKDDDLIRLGLN